MEPDRRHGTPDDSCRGTARRDGAVISSRRRSTEIGHTDAGCLLSLVGQHVPTFPRRVGNTASSGHDNGVAPPTWGPSGSPIGDGGQVPPRCGTFIPHAHTHTHKCGSTTPGQACPRRQKKKAQLRTAARGRPHFCNLRNGTANRAPVPQCNRSSCRGCKRWSRDSAWTSRSSSPPCHGLEATTTPVARAGALWLAANQRPGSYLVNELSRDAVELRHRSEDWLLRGPSAPTMRGSKPA